MRDWLSHRAGTTPSATVLLDTDSGRRWSAADLDEVVDRTAGYLSALGVGDGDHVGVVLEDQLTAIDLLWATMRLGAVHVPFRPDWDAETLRARANAADVTTIVCEEATEPTAAEAAVAPTVTVDEADADGVETLSDREPVSVTSSTWTRSEPTTIAFTAGATGEARPVVLEMGNHLSNATDAAFRFGALPTDRWLCCHPLHHVNGLATVFRVMLSGSTLVLEDESKPGGLADVLDSYDVTCLTAPPATVTEMLDARGMLSDSLRAVVVTGAPVPRSLLDRCHGYSIPALPAYSLTETAGFVTAAVPGATADESGSAGHPLLRTEVTVVGSDGTPLGRGQTGEIVVSGPSTTPGYYDSATGAPTNANGRGIATGDVGFRDEDGRLRVISRRTDRILVGGETVRAGDVRDVICEHEGVADAAVVGVPDAERGERPAALVASADPESPPDAGALRKHCEARLAGFVAPEQFAFTAELPRTPSGDVDRHAVRQRLLERDTAGMADPPDREEIDERPSVDSGEIEDGSG